MLKANNYYLIKQASIIIIFLVILFFFSIYPGNFIVKPAPLRIFLWLLVFIFVLKIIFYFRIIRKTEKEKFQNPEAIKPEKNIIEKTSNVAEIKDIEKEKKTPEEKINVEEKKSFSIPDSLEGKYQANYEKALSLIVFGDLQKAENHMSNIDWTHAPTEISAMHLAAMACIKILKGEIPEGTSLLQEAEKVSLSGNFEHNPKTDKTAIIVLKILKSIIDGSPNTERMSRLEEKMVGFMPFERVLGAWTLANGYKKMGNQGKAELYLSFCRRRAPFCKYLHSYIN
jgi:hypothetical protein